MPTYGYLLPTRGVVLTSDTDSVLTAKTNAEIVDMAARAEALGFGSVWVGDSVLAKPRLEALTTLAAVATRTEAVDLGTAVYLPALRDPIHVAHMTATVDQLSGGRLNLGVGVGIGPDVAAEYDNLDLPYRERGRRTDELLEVVRELWSGDSVDYDGEYFDLDDASIGFSPARTPKLYVPSAAFDPSEGFPRSIRNRIVEHGDGWLPIGVSPDAYASAFDDIRGHLEDAGRDPEPFDAGMYLDVVVGEKDAAIEEARAFYERYYPEWDTLSREQIEAKGAFGPPAEVAETLAAYEDAGVEKLVVRFTATDQGEQLARFAEIAEL